MSKKPKDDFDVPEMKQSDLDKAKLKYMHKHHPERTVDQGSSHEDIMEGLGGHWSF